MLHLWCCSSSPRSASDWRTEGRLEELKSAIGFFNGKWFWSDARKQAQEVIFSWKIKKSTHPPLVFNNAVISQTNSKKHLGVTLHLKLTIKEHLLNTFGKGDRIIGLLQKLQNVLPKITLVTIYKAFLWSRLDYEDILYDQVLNNIFHDRLESIHFYACLAITGAIRGTHIHCVKSVQLRSFFWSVFSCIRTEYGEILRISPYSVRMWEDTDQKELCIWTLLMQWSSEKLYQELGLEPLRLWLWYNILNSLSI